MPTCLRLLVASDFALTTSARRLYSQRQRFGHSDSEFDCLIRFICLFVPLSGPSKHGSSRWSACWQGLYHYWRRQLERHWVRHLPPSGLDPYSSHHSLPPPQSWHFIWCTALSSRCVHDRHYRRATALLYAHQGAAALYLLDFDGTNLPSLNQEIKERYPEVRVSARRPQWKTFISVLPAWLALRHLFRRRGLC